MTRCTECGAQSRQGIRRLRTDTNAAPAVVTTALYQQLPEAVGETADQVGAGRKLLMFSDSRQGGSVRGALSEQDLFAIARASLHGAGASRRRRWRAS